MPTGKAGVPAAATRRKLSMRRIDICRAVVAAVCGLMLAVPASAPAQDGCPGQSVGQVFMPWSDPAWYTTVPDGGMESQQGAWSLRGPAAFVGGNEPYFVRSPGDSWSLSLPSGASAVSLPTCISIGHPTLRLFTRTANPAGGTLRITAEFVDVAGIPRSQQIAVLIGGTSWAPTAQIPIVVNLVALVNPRQVKFRFLATGQWFLDDVYVDPYGKG
jgi:hypothetical protein